MSLFTVRLAAHSGPCVDSWWSACEATGPLGGLTVQACLQVMALLDGGGYAEQAVAPEGFVMHIPDRLGFEEAAGIPEVGVPLAWWGHGGCWVAPATAGSNATLQALQPRSGCCAGGRCSTWEAVACMQLPRCPQHAGCICIFILCPQCCVSAIRQQPPRRCSCVADLHHSLPGADHAGAAEEGAERAHPCRRLWCR